MAAPLMSRNKADILAAAAFIAAIIILAISGTWWPHLFLAFGIPIMLRQYVRGRPYDVGLSALVFGGLFLTFLIDMHWNYLIPILLVCGALFISYREYALTRRRVGSDLTEDVKTEIDDAEHK